MGAAVSDCASVWPDLTYLPYVTPTVCKAGSAEGCNREGAVFCAVGIAWPVSSSSLYCLPISQGLRPEEVLASWL